MKILPVLFAFVTLAFPLRADPPASRPAPPGALLARAPEPASWVITTHPADSSHASPAGDSSPAPAAKTRKRQKLNEDVALPSQRVTVTKGGGVIHLQFEDKQAGTSEKWCRGDIEVTTRPDWAEPVVSVRGDRDDTIYIDFSKSDFPEVSWVNRKNYVGIEKLQGRICMFFKDRLSINAEDRTASPAPAPQTVDVAAYIDYYSRLPVSASRAGMTSDYQFDLPPEAGQALPPNVEKVIADHQKRLGELSRAPQ